MNCRLSLVTAGFDPPRSWNESGESAQIPHRERPMGMSCYAADSRIFRCLSRVRGIVGDVLSPVMAKEEVRAWGHGIG